MVMFYGFRKACSNGLIIEIPIGRLNQADIELTESMGGAVLKATNEIEVISQITGKVRHMGNADKKQRK